MASSSKTDKDYDMLMQIEGEEEKGKETEEIDRDWLELSLGFGTACGKSSVVVHGSNSASSASASTSNSSSSFLLPAQHQSELGLGFDDVGVREPGVVPSSNDDRLSCEHHGLVPDHDYDGIPSPSSSPSPSPSFMLCSPPPSLSSRPLPMGSTSFLELHGLQMPVPNHTHHYPQRPQSGLWFTLRSLINREGDVLPQVPKAYIRVKEEKVTVFMVKTYLVRKLGLSNEAEIDVSCMGQKLRQWETLKHVRDAIWLPRLIESVNSKTTLIENYNMSVNHLMSLDYGRRHLN